MSSISSISSSAWQPVKPDVGKVSDKLFNRLDQDRGGAIDETELSTVAKQAGATESDIAVLMKGLDSDGDKAISKQELTAGMQALSDQFEANFNAARTSEAAGLTGAAEQGGAAGSDESDEGKVAASLLAIAGADGAEPPAAKAVAAGKTSAASAPAEQTTYEQADANEDGTVSEPERLAYEAAQALKAAQQSAAKTDKAGDDAGAAERVAQAYASGAVTVTAGATVAELA